MDHPFAEPLTWNAVERAALMDPILYAAVTLVSRGDMTREQALMSAAVAQARLVQIYKDEVTACLAKCSCGGAFDVIAKRK